MNINVNLMVQNVTQVKSGIKNSINVNAKIQKKNHVCVKNYIWNPSTCACKIGKYFKSIIISSVFTCDEIIEMTKAIPTKTVPTKIILTKTVPTNFNEKKITFKIENFCISLNFSLIAISLLIIVSIYHCLIKHL